MTTVTAKDIDVAAGVLAKVATKTPLQKSERLSEEVGRPVYLKREDLQICRSYKVRGAYVRMAAMDEDERAAGVVCASAGNHAQGVAYACAGLHSAAKTQTDCHYRGQMGRAGDRGWGL